MKASALIAELIAIVNHGGDAEVLVDLGASGYLPLDDDVAMDGDAIWLSVK